MHVIHTRRLMLEPLVTGHAEEMFKVLSEPALYEFEGAAPSSVQWLRERFSRLETRRSSDGSEIWLNWVIRQRSGKLSGYVQATIHPNGEADVAYVLAVQHWGKGFATEAVAAMLQELAGSYGVTRFAAVLKQANLRSKRLLQRLGFVPAAAEAALARQLPGDEILMQLGSGPERRGVCFSDRRV